MDARKNPPFTPASPQDIDDQIAKIARRAISSSVAGPGGRAADCFVIGTSDASETQGGMTLGPYARWLVAARLILRGEQGKSLSEALSTPEVQTNRVFTVEGNSDKWLKEAHRYFSPAASGDLQKVLSAMLDRLDLTYGRSRGQKIQVGAFIRQYVPVGSATPSDDDLIGEEAFNWFEHWLRYGAGFPSRTSLNNLPCLDSETHRALEKSHAFKRAFSWLDLPERALGYQRIVNVHGEPLVTSGENKDMPHSAMAVKIASSVSRPVVYVRLNSGASRRGVLKQLYEAFYIPTTALDALDHRPIDLARDLAPVRRAITVNDVLLIFDAWQNGASTFAALDEYLCNTHWAEFLRVLAQPDMTVRSDSSVANEVPTLRYAVLVMTARKSIQLSPWARFASNSTLSRSQRPASAAHRATGEAEDRTRPELAGIKQILELVRSVRSGASGAEPAWEKLGAIMCRRLVAASVNGVREDTLRRCLDHWHRLFWVVDAAEEQQEKIHEPCNAFDNVIGKLAEQPGLMLGEDEEIERLSIVRRSLELDARPGAIQPRVAEEPKCLFKFKDLASRAEFVKRWTDEESAFTASADELSLNRCSWAHAHYLLGEESLRQSTLQLLHLQTPDVCDPYEVRRAVQSIYHGLMSLGLREEHFARKAVRRGLLYGPMFPPDARRRYKYLYTFLLRQVVDEDAWKITRAFGRADVRVDLLTLFLAPQLGPRLLTEADAERDPLEDLTLDQISPYLATDSKMWSNLLLALARSGLELGGPRGDSATNWALRMLPGGDDSALTNALLPPRSSGAYHRTAASALKARIDWLQHTGHFRRNVVSGVPHDGAADLCMQELRWLGVGQQLLDDLRTNVRAAYETLWRPNAAPSGTNIADSLQDALTKALETLKEALRSSADSREAASSALFRLAQVLATEDDDARSRGGVVVTDDEHESDQRRVARRQQVATYAHICALCWLADNVRLGYGSPKRMGMKWPLAGARVMRFYIRVTLKLARLLADAHPTALLKTSSNGKRDAASLIGLVVRLLEHAQHRQGVYVRQHRVRRERVAILLLEVARLRTWMRIELTKKKCAQTAQIVFTSELEQFAWYWRLLEASESLLQEAENHLFALGYQRVHVRRLCLERIKTAETMTMVNEAFPIAADESKEAAAMLAEVRHQKALAVGLLEVLRQAAGSSSFWKTMVDRQSARLKPKNKPNDTDLD